MMWWHISRQNTVAHLKKAKWWTSGLKTRPTTAYPPSKTMFLLNIFRELFGCIKENALTLSNRQKWRNSLHLIISIDTARMQRLHKSLMKPSRLTA